MNQQILFSINNLAGKNTILDTFMVFSATKLIYVVFLLAVFAIGVLIYKKEWTKIIYFVLNLGIAFIFLHIASLMYVDHRPFVDLKVHQLVAHAAGKSFPSDHTTAAFAIGIGALLFINRKLGIICIILAALIGFARIFVGIHYPIDIGGGILVAIVASAIVYFLKQKQYGMRLMQKK